MTVSHPPYVFAHLICKVNSGGTGMYIRKPGFGEPRIMLKKDFFFKTKIPATVFSLSDDFFKAK